MRSSDCFFPFFLFFVGFLRAFLAESNNARTKTQIRQFKHVASGPSFILDEATVDEAAKYYGIQHLKPNSPGRCWFHSQRLNPSDADIFKRLGGKILQKDWKDCGFRRKKRMRYSEAVICDCIAPPNPEAFNKHFLEIGALDGQYLSNLLFFEKQMNWTGICIEGSPISYERLKKNRPSCSNYNNVIGPELFSWKTFYSFQTPKGYSSVMGSYLSCMQGVQGCPKNDNAARRKGALISQVQMRTLADIFEEVGYSEFGWISVDVEGAENIVIQTIDFGKVRADLVSYEGRRPGAANYLKTNGYEFAYKHGAGDGDQFFHPARGGLFNNSTIISS